MSTHRLVFLFSVCLLLASAADAQTLTGRVADPHGAVVVGAEVTVSGGGLPAPRTTRSTADGTFSFDAVALGRHELTVAAPGFSVWTKEVTVAAAGADVPVALQVASLAEDVQVRGEVIDTSLTKSNVPAKDQPMNVSVVSSRYLQTFAINNLVEALATVPNVNAYQQYGVYEYYTFRGFQSDTQMVDGIRNEGNRVKSGSSNVDHIEVLKGPGAVLSGNEAISSAVNIVLKKPTGRTMYDSAFSFGSFNTTRASGGASGKLGRESLLYRIDAGVDNADNFRHDASNKVNVTPTLTWQMTRADRLEVRYAFNRNDVSGDSGIPLVTRTDGTTFIPDVPRDRRYNTPQDFALSYDHNLRVQYSRPFGNNFTFRNITSPRWFDDEYWVAESMSVVTGTTDVSRTFLYFKHKRRPVTNQAEFNGSVKFGVPQKFLIGWDHQGYHNRTTRSDKANITTTRINLYNPVETHQTWTDFTVSRYDHQQNYTDGLYLQDHVELGAKLKAVVMGRQDWVDRTTYNNPVVNGVEGTGTVTPSKQRRLSARYGLVYQPASRLDLYGQYATSYKPNFNLQPDGSELKPEIGAQWEVGQRFRIMGDRMYVNAAAFGIARQNVALSQPGGFFDQAGQITSQGFEAELDGNFASWYVNFSYGYTDAKYVDYVQTSNAGVKTVLSGKSVPRAPHNSFSYQAARNLKKMQFAVSGRTLGDQFLDNLNTLSFESYSLLNLAASYRQGRIAYTLNFNNLTNTEYWASILGSKLYYPGEGFRVMAGVRLLVN